MKVTNNSKAPQGVHTGVGVVFIRPGESRDVELSVDGHKQASRLKFLSVSGAAPKAEGADSEKADLIAQLKALGIDVQPNSRVDTLRKKLEEARPKADGGADERDALIASLNEKNIAFEPTDSLEELQAKLAAAE